MIVPRWDGSNRPIGSFMQLIGLFFVETCEILTAAFLTSRPLADPAVLEEELEPPEACAGADLLREHLGESRRVGRQGRTRGEVAVHETFL